MDTNLELDNLLLAFLFCDQMRALRSLHSEFMLFSHILLIINFITNIIMSNGYVSCIFCTILETESSSLIKIDFESIQKGCQHLSESFGALQSQIDVFIYRKQIDCIKSKLDQIR